jgi:cell division septation protein DedD
LPVGAQSLGSGPAEAPPAGFSGGQYVDSQGCVFLRAGVGNETRWVRRIGADRRPICGQTPTRTTMARARGAIETADAAPAAAGSRPAPAAGAPMPTVAATATGQPPRAEGAARPRSTVPASSYAAPRVANPARPAVAAAAPAAAPAPARPVAAAPRAPAAATRTVTPGCPERAPVGERYRLTDGRTVLVCTVPGVRISGSRPGDPPVMPAHVGGGARSDAPRAGDPRAPATHVPRGYRLAWKDDRLNPHRGPRSAQGNQQMFAIWNDRVPQDLRDEAPRRGVAAVSAKAPTVARPARASQPAARTSAATPARAPAPAAAGGRLIQVGSYADPGNARRAVARLQSLGLPVQVGAGRIGGKPVQVVRAGPFADAGAAQAALRAARAAGYRDAFLRN